MPSIVLCTSHVYLPVYCKTTESQKKVVTVVIPVKIRKEDKSDWLKVTWPVRI